MWQCGSVHYSLLSDLEMAWWRQSPSCQIQSDRCRLTPHLSLTYKIPINPGGGPPLTCLSPCWLHHHGEVTRTPGAALLSSVIISPLLYPLLSSPLRACQHSQTSQLCLILTSTVLSRSHWLFTQDQITFIWQCKELLISVFIIWLIELIDWLNRLAQRGQHRAQRVDFVLVEKTIYHVEDLCCHLILKAAASSIASKH